MKKVTLKHLIRLRKSVIFFAVTMILNAGLITLSQLTAFTPRIVEENGNTPQNSIAELRELELNGRKQWISLSGWDKNAPVLLFLAGGPGGTQMAAVRHELAELEKHFVIVNWDQLGSGKSYYAEEAKKITVQTYIQDGHALTEYLKERFSQEKIYLVGESWGSALGIFFKSGLFTVTVSETDKYDIRITGKDATGKVIVKNVENVANMGAGSIE